MGFDPLPPFAAWRHRDARDGFEVVFLRPEAGGLRFDGHTAAVEDGEAWSVTYSILVDAAWTTRRAHVRAEAAAGRREIELAHDGAGGWSLDGAPLPELQGCADVDLESSAFTNALPVHRLRLGPGEAADVPAAYVRAPALAVDRLEQRYVRADGGTAGERYAYEAPRFAFSAELAYDRHGLLLDYPGLARRAG